MKIRHLFFLLLFLLTTVLMSFQLPKNIQKKTSKEIKTTYEVENFTLVSILISDEINSQLDFEIEENSFFKILNNSEQIGYAYIDKAPSKTDEFDYLVLFDNDFIIKKTKVLIYREDYGSEIGSKRWLRQFVGKTKGQKLKYEKDIIAISGATISARSLTVAINNLLQSIETLQQKNIL
ncbi:MAG: FMN-binding protein [Lutibacter sp.]|nr:MAG: FMN-binding protein [Lutibacter sp.]